MNNSDNPLLNVVYDNEGIVLYAPIDYQDYHKSREVAMQVQERYSKAGISKDVLTAMADKAIEHCNKQTNMDTLRTDMGIMWNNLKARMSNPIDELCCIRMGAIACFLENEPSDSVQMAFTDKKVRLAEQHPELYAFFLNMGISFTPVYSTLLRSLSVEDYLNNRREMLNGLTIQATPKTA